MSENEIFCKVMSRRWYERVYYLSVCMVLHGYVNFTEFIRIVFSFVAKCKIKTKDKS